MQNLNIGDFIYAIDENRVYEIDGLPSEEARNKYYHGSVVRGSSSRGFDPEANHYRLATEEEINAASRSDKVLKIKKESEAYELIYKCYHYHEKWNEHKVEIEEFLGFEKNENLYHSVSALYINPKMIKEEWKDQFKKNTSPAQAKSGSKINKQWIALCKKLGLEVHDLQSFRIKFGLYFHGFSIHNFSDEYYIEFKDGLSGGSLNDWAEAISEPDFLRIKADYLEKNPK
jgi:hypothetical protein